MQQRQMAGGLKAGTGDVRLAVDGAGFGFRSILGTPIKHRANAHHAALCHGHQNRCRTIEEFAANLRLSIVSPATLAADSIQTQPKRRSL
jgi:hypothetical protein